jgi:hypothetical protein
LLKSGQRKNNQISDFIFVPQHFPARHIFLSGKIVEKARKFVKLASRRSYRMMRIVEFNKFWGIGPVIPNCLVR